MSDHPQRIDRESVQDLVREEQARLVEVLDASAFDALHLPAAINTPLSELNEESAAQLDRSRPVVVYCYDYQ